MQARSIFFIALFLVLTALFSIFPAPAGEDGGKPVPANQSLEIITGGAISPQVREKLEPLYRPTYAFEDKAPPPAPDYWTSETWAALPAREDEADCAPPNTLYPEKQKSALCDAFFVHPTGYQSKASWNAPWDDREAAKATSEMMLYCASVFNASCRVYAPRYRQATLWAFFEEKGPSGMMAADLAYSDVKRAFEHFIRFRNQARPFILAGHSQGSSHCMRLLQERIIGTALARRLVAAYLVGYPVPVSLSGIKPSHAANDTGVTISWTTYTPGSDTSFLTNATMIWLDGSYRRIGEMPIVQVNPLSWKLGGGPVPPSSNPGSLPVPLSPDDPVSLVPGVCGADASGRVLIIAKPQHPGFPGFGPDMPLLNPDFGDYHNYDYSLFYESIRGNVVERVKAFLSEKKQ